MSRLLRGKVSFVGVGLPCSALAAFAACSISAFAARNPLVKDVDAMDPTTSERGSAICVIVIPCCGVSGKVELRFGFANLVSFEVWSEVTCSRFDRCCRFRPRWMRRRMQSKRNIRIAYVECVPREVKKEPVTVLMFRGAMISK